MNKLPILLLSVAALLGGSVAPTAGAQDLAALEQQSLRAAVQAVADSVVQIRTLGGLDRVDGESLAQGPTSGLIVSDDGYIVSSAINFAQQPSSVIVRLPSGAQRPAEIVGRDTNRMLVLLKVEAEEPLPVPTAAKLAEVRPGDWAVAVGRTNHEDQVNVSVGIVSALGRMHDRVLQTDANVSAANYGGPLVDVSGQVLGVLVPMSPQSAGGDEPSAIAGAEYYDSGIGFAVPLSHVFDVLERWKDQQDLKRGLLGIGLKSGNPHATPPTITAVWPGSPAAKALWKPEDRIVAVEGEPVQSQTELRFRIVPRYAGDSFEVTIRRGAGDDAEELKTVVTLADELPPFRHAFLGVLPMRGAAATSTDNDESENGEGEKVDDEDAAEEGEEKSAPPISGVLVRAVWPESPAAAIGLAPGDRVTKLGDEKVASIDAAIVQLSAKNPGDKLDVQVIRGDDELELTATLAELPVQPLKASELAPPAGDANASQETDKLPLLEMKLPEMPQTAHYLEPPTEGAAPGLLVWLGDGKATSAEALADAWQKACRRDGLILLIPEPGDEKGWTADDMEYLARLLQTAVQRFDVDRRRVVVAGEGRGGQLAYALAFASRQMVRGVAVIESPLPRTLELPKNSPNSRLAVLSVETENTPLSLVIRADLRRLAEEGYPAARIIRRPAESDAPLDASTRGKISRWIDGLDRY